MQAVHMEVPRSIKRYVADTFVHTASVQEHIYDLDRLMSVYAKYRLRLNDKSKLFPTRIKFLGHWIEHNKTEPIIDTEDIRNWPMPTDGTA